MLSIAQNQEFTKLSFCVLYKINGQIRLPE